VTDTGVGIPNNIKPKLFNLYATFDYGNGTNRQGNGLGLVICKKLVGLLGPTE
jgi:signal transduction histidine kinase